MFAPAAAPPPPTAASSSESWEIAVRGEARDRRRVGVVSTNAKGEPPPSPAAAAAAVAFADATAAASADAAAAFAAFAAAAAATAPDELGVGAASSGGGGAASMAEEDHPPLLGLATGCRVKNVESSCEKVDEFGVVIGESDWGERGGGRKGREEGGVNGVRAFHGQRMGRSDGHMGRRQKNTTCWSARIPPPKLSG